ncbi:MAG: response regulator [Caldilineaceae bacterium]|nr:response regulator [Caldilineaceae bacterium]
MANSTYPPDFVEHLHHALANLYDPFQLRESLLIHRLKIEGQGNPATLLRQQLIAAIEGLEAGTDAPPHSPLHSYHYLLNQRFVEQFTQKEVADDFGLSVRQLRRREKQAIEVLANHLAYQYDLVEAAPDPLTAAITTPSRQAELAWSQQTFPGDVTDAASLVASALQVAHPLLQSLRVRIESRLPAALPRLVVETVSARQALIGILTLLARQMPGSRFIVQAEVMRQAVQIQIYAVENAPMPAFHEAEATEGLRMAEQLIALSGGKLSLGDKSGSVQPIVRLTLPAEQQVTVLAVDDNPDTLQLLERYTSNSRFNLVGVRQPQQVLSMAEKLMPEILILDVMLPEIDGWQLLGQLRAHPTFEEVPIIVCTILPQEALALTLGASAFLRKPVRQDDFLRLLDAHSDGLS